MVKDDFTRSIKSEELHEGEMKATRLRGKPVLLARVSGQVYALSNFCPHMGCQLQGGILTSNTVMCPCHGWKFDIRNGEYLEIPQVKLETYQCKEEAGRIFVKMLANNF